MLRRTTAALVVITGAAAFTPTCTPALRSVRPSVCHVHMGKDAADGLFSPVVKAAKVVLGETTLNKVRGDVIGQHSKVISAFCDSSESAVGKIALKQLYRLADKDGNGKLDKEELKEALQKLGFSHLGDAQIEGIFARADKDGNCEIDFEEFMIDGIFARADADGSTEIDFEEFMAEAPKTLRTNLIKLAKTNGNDLGFLS